MPSEPLTPPRPAVLLDLDGTLVDSTFQHVSAWRDAFAQAEVPAAQWRLHRRIGMGSRELVRGVLAELGVDRDDELVSRLLDLHKKLYAEERASVRPLPGARELLEELSRRDVPWAIATSDHADSARETVALLELPEEPRLVCGDDIETAKPDPAILLAAADLLGAAPAGCFVVGDAVWDVLAARRAGMLGVGVRSGGVAVEDFVRAGAYRAYDGVDAVLAALDELGLPG
jgi:HAD superfamily hydrolase (TIGR01509 family)